MPLPPRTQRGGGLHPGQREQLRRSETFEQRKSFGEIGDGMEARTIRKRHWRSVKTDQPDDMTMANLEHRAVQPGGEGVGGVDDEPDAARCDEFGQRRLVERSVAELAASGRERLNAGFGRVDEGQAEPG